MPLHSMYFAFRLALYGSITLNSWLTGCKDLPPRSHWRRNDVPSLISFDRQREKSCDRLFGHSVTHLNPRQMIISHWSKVWVCRTIHESASGGPNAKWKRINYSVALGVTPAEGTETLNLSTNWKCSTRLRYVPRLRSIYLPRPP